jgi:hypothetical protein
MYKNDAVSFRVKVNNMWMLAHDFTLGKDFLPSIQVSYHAVVSLC